MLTHTKTPPFANAGIPGVTAGLRTFVPTVNVPKGIVSGAKVLTAVPITSAPHDVIEPVTATGRPPANVIPLPVNIFV
jgi:hypothetical protein